MTTTRRHDIDCIRIFATYLLLPFHVGMVFNPQPFYHVRNEDVSMVFLVACSFIGLFHMPLFFLAAGWSALPSLRARGMDGYRRERVRKLLVPLIVGTILFGPVIKFVELSNGLDMSAFGLRVAARLQPTFRTVFSDRAIEVLPPFESSFLAFLPTFFTLEGFTWSHLWTLAYLFTFALAYRRRFERWLAAGDRFVAPRAAHVYAPILPLVLIQVVLRPFWPGVQNLVNDWANIAYYTTYYFAGFHLAQSPALETLVVAERRRAFALGLATSLVLLLGVIGVLPSAVLLPGSAIAGWCLVVTIVGTFRRFATHDGPVFRYLRDSAFPVYILHQVVVVLLGATVVRLPWSIGPKFVVLLVASTLGTIAAYHVAVRGFRLPRAALGMSPLRVAAASLVLTLAGPCAVEATTPAGRWYAEGGAAQVELVPCGAGWCGDVVWLRSPFDANGCPLRDIYNPEPALRTRDVVGLRILRDLAPVNDTTWDGGTIYDPTSGRTYRVTATMSGRDRLLVRGWLGVRLLGRTTTWMRVGTEPATCQQLGPAL